MLSSNTVTLGSGIIFLKWQKKQHALCTFTFSVKLCSVVLVKLLQYSPVNSHTRYAEIMCELSKPIFT